MSGWGTPEERAAALRVDQAVGALNDAIHAIDAIGVYVRVIDVYRDITGMGNRSSRLRVEIMERRYTVRAPFSEEEAVTEGDE